MSDDSGQRGAKAPDASGPKPAGENPRKARFSTIVSRINAFVRRRAAEPTIRASIEDILGEGGVTEEMSVKERAMLQNLLKFGELTVADLMVPRADIIGVEDSASLAETAAIFFEAQHSRLPVYKDTLDEPIGMIHIKDVIGYLMPGREPQPFSLQRIKRDVLFVPPSMPAQDLLLKMQATRIHLALVIDEYGGTDGLLSIEDLVEQIVGEIDDEHDTDEEAELKPVPGGFEADARVPVEDLEKAAGVELATTEEREEHDTLGGLVAKLAGRLPQRGEVIAHESGVEFEVIDADPRRIKRLRIRRAASPQPDA